LREVPDPRAVFALHLSRGGFFAAQDEAQEGGLARAVPADEPDAVPGGEAEVDRAQDDPGIVFLGEILKSDEAHLPAR
jgi:hypothetical protein